LPVQPRGPGATASAFAKYFVATTLESWDFLPHNFDPIKTIVALGDLAFQA
jgi:hypothetical protein